MNRPEAAAARFCKDCRWCQLPPRKLFDNDESYKRRMGRDAYCRLPNYTNVVTGEPVSRFYPCDVARLEGAVCGPTARFFEARHPSPPGAE